MAYVLCLKEMHVISVTGHSLVLENKLAPQPVPDVLIPELLKLGCVQCDAEGNVLVNGQPIAVQRMKIEITPEMPPVYLTASPVPTIAEEQRIDAAVAAVLDEGNPDNISRKQGLPKVHAVSELAGFSVSRLQIVASCVRLGRT